MFDSFDTILNQKYFSFFLHWMFFNCFGEFHTIFFYHIPDYPIQIKASKMRKWCTELVKNNKTPKFKRAIILNDAYKKTTTTHKIHWKLVMSCVLMQRGTCWFETHLLSWYKPKIHTRFISSPTKWRGTKKAKKKVKITIMISDGHLFVLPSPWTGSIICLWIILQLNISLKPHVLQARLV